jgi:hypothetical protein
MPRTENYRCKLTYCSIGQIYASQKIIVRGKKKVGIRIKKTDNLSKLCQKQKKNIEPVIGGTESVLKI